MIISQSNFIEEHIPEYHPATTLYKDYWREQIRRNIEGYWQSGYWMPPKLYFYANFATIKKKINDNSKVQSFGRPLLRDIEWIVFRDITVARGFSGFELDDTYSCNELLLEELPLEQLPPSCINSQGERKIYEDPTYYISKQHASNLGKALYENEASNYILMGARGFGKSYMVGGVIAHEFLFDGMMEYIPGQKPDSVDIVVGAGHSNFSTDLLTKAKIMMDRVPGQQEILGTIYPSPLSKKTMGSLTPSSILKALYKKRIGSRWQDAGSLSTIKHVSYADNPFAAQGGRNSIMIYEEVGMHSNVLECFDASVENMRLNGRKFGTAIFLGTGGDMEGGGTIGAKEIFYNPGKYDALRFEDTYEKKGHIGRFIPATYNLGSLYRDDNNITDLQKAVEELLRRRKAKENKKGSESALTKEIVNNPINPSEMFLAENAALLPAAEAARRLQELEADRSYNLIEKVVELYFDPDARDTNNVNYKIDSAGKLKPITQFPHKDKDREGAIIIYEFPAMVNGKVPEGAYVIGHDPYKDDNERGDSLASIYVVKSAKYFNDIGHDEIVAEYVGRPYDGMNKVNETILKLSLFYGEAKIYFENAVGNTKDYFERIKRLDLLATKPTALFTTTASYARSPTIEYGYPMSNQFIKRKGISYLRDWLLQERGDGKRNIDLINSRALLQEIAYFTYEGNFDRVMGLMGAIFGLAQMTRNMEESLHMPKKDTSPNLDFIFNNKKLFRNVATNFFSSTEDVVVPETQKWTSVGQRHYRLYN